MGRYVEYDGVIDFKTKKAFDAFLKLMIDNDWYDKKKDSWKSEGGILNDEIEPEDQVPVVMEGDGVYAIILPSRQIYAFDRLLNGLEMGTWEGEIRGVSDDQGFDGFIIHPDKEEEYFDLEEWAKENNLSLEWDEDSEDWLTEDRCDVMEAFIENPKRPTNSMRFILTEDSDEKKIISP
jgi:hypothetical protein